MNKKAYIQPILSVTKVFVESLMQSASFTISSSEKSDGWADSRSSDIFWDDEE